MLIPVDNGLKYHLIGLLHFRPEEGIASFDAYSIFAFSTPMRLHHWPTCDPLLADLHQQHLWPMDFPQ